MGPLALADALEAADTGAGVAATAGVTVVAAAAAAGAGTALRNQFKKTIKHCKLLKLKKDIRG